MELPGAEDVGAFINDLEVVVLGGQVPTPGTFEVHAAGRPRGLFGNVRYRMV